MTFFCFAVDMDEKIARQKDQPHHHFEIAFDGIVDVRHGRQLSTMWHDAGISNELDISGQSAQLALKEEEVDDVAPSGLEAQQTRMPHQLVHAVNMARAFGLEVRDRLGNQFNPSVTKEGLHEHITREYRQSIFQCVTFGLPVCILHLLAPWLSKGAGEDASSMAFPWLIEMLLCGWMLRVAIWPVIWQGALSLCHLRMTGDLFACLVLGVMFFPSSWGVLSLLWQKEPWFMTSRINEPLFYICAIYGFLLVYQRWGMHRFFLNLSGRMNRMLPGLSHMLWIVLFSSGLMYLWQGYIAMISLLILMPPLLSIGVINPWYPGASLILTLASFAILIFAGQRPMANLGYDIRGIEYVVTLSFHACLAVFFVMGWKRMDAVTYYRS